MTAVPEIAGFRFQQQLAHAARCELWRAEQCTLERDVLVMVFEEEIYQNRELGDALFGVIRALAQEKLSLLPDVIDIIRGAERAYVILEDNHAQGILSLLHGQPLDAERLLDLAIALAEGFSELHRAHLVYGGLRPRRLFLSETFAPYLLDISTVSFEPGFGQNPPLDALVGAAPYVAPEQYLQPEAVDTRADMFALGMTLYALGTGQVPFGHYAPEVVLERKLHEEIPSPCDVRAEFPRAFAAVLGKLSRRLPEARYADWDEVLFDLHEARRGNVPFGAGEEGSVIAVPRERSQANGERLIRLSASRLQAYRQMQFRQLGHAWWVWWALLLAVAVVLAGIFWLVLGVMA